MLNGLLGLFKGSTDAAAPPPPAPEPAPTPPPPALTAEQAKASVDVLRERMAQLDARKERLMKQKPAVRAAGLPEAPLLPMRLPPDAGRVVVRG